MKRIDIRAWTSPVKMRLTIANYAKMMMSITAVNGFYALQSKGWVILGINTLFFIPALITIISKSKFDKLPPQQE